MDKTYKQPWIDDLTRHKAAEKLGVVAGVKISKGRTVPPGTDPHCNKYGDRVFSVDEALSLMLLPCSEKCVCYWCPVLKSE